MCGAGEREGNGDGERGDLDATLGDHFASVSGRRTRKSTIP